MPIHPDEWDGMGRAQREAMISVHEDALLLGLDFEEMDGNLVKEAHRIRAELNHIRSLGREVNFLRMPRIGFFSAVSRTVGHLVPNFSFLWARVNPCSRCLVRFTQVL